MKMTMSHNITSIGVLDPLIHYLERVQIRDKEMFTPYLYPLYFVNRESRKYFEPLKFPVSSCEYPLNDIEKIHWLTNRFDIPRNIMLEWYKSACKRGHLDIL